jgi:hypothetical protein
MAARRVLGITAGAIALIALQARAGPPSANALDSAQYASRIPLYPGAQLSGESGRAWSRTLFGPPAVARRTWWFRVHASSGRLVDFYERKLPSAAQRERGQGEVSFAVIPDGAVAGEALVVTVREGQVQVEETTLLR